MGHGYDCEKCGYESCICNVCRLCKFKTWRCRCAKDNPKAEVTVSNHAVNCKKCRREIHPLDECPCITEPRESGPYFRYRDLLPEISARDVETLVRKDVEYGGSWKRRGGRGAWFMLCRKFDRLEQAVKRADDDIFEAGMHDTRDEGIIDDLADLRCYLLLVEAEIRARGEREDAENTE